jgi:hypothetical protein
LLSLESFGQARKIERALLATMTGRRWKAEKVHAEEDQVTAALFAGYPDRLVWHDLDHWTCGRGRYELPADVPYDSHFAYGLWCDHKLALAVGLVYRPRARFGRNLSYVALAAITPERVRELMPSGTVSEKEEILHYDTTAGRVLCTKSWYMAGYPFYTQGWQPASPGRPAAWVLAKAIEEGQLEHAVSDELARLQKLASRVPPGELPILDNQQLITWRTTRLAELNAVSAVDVLNHPESLHLG